MKPFISLLSARRVLFVHAHPDDETLTSGATMARYAAEGAQVTLVTCTLGEEGEVFVPELSGLAADQADQLGGYRYAELSRACAALGVTDFRLLGGAGRYRDSGMMGWGSNDHPRSFWRAELNEAVGHLVAVIREVRPHVVVTYDPSGQYGHPDHLRAHRVTMAAVARAGKPQASDALSVTDINVDSQNAPWAVPRVLWSAMPRSLAAAGFARFAASGGNPLANAATVDELPFVLPDAQIEFRIDASAYGEAKKSAMAAHATQVPAESWMAVMAENFGIEPLGVEYYRFAATSPDRGHGVRQGPAVVPLDDLFAGLTVS